MKTDQNSCEIAEAEANSTTENLNAAAAVSPTASSSSNTAISSASKKPVKKTGQKKGQPGESSGRDEIIKSQTEVKPPVADVKQNDGELVAEQKVETTTI